MSPPYTFKWFKIETSLQSPSFASPGFTVINFTIKYVKSQANMHIKYNTIHIVYIK